jgi:toxin ParE1/3/4
MSARRTVVLSPDARADVSDILLYTREHWGKSQHDRYATVLERTIANVTDFPEAGGRCYRLFPGCRIRRVERHVLYYRITNGSIEIVHILHERTDPTRHLRS